LDRDQAKAVLVEFNRRFNPSYKERGPGEILFKKQLDFDKDPSKRKIALCSRRAGKTTVAADGLIRAALMNPGIQHPYIALTKESALRIIWSMLLDLLGQYGIKFESNETKLSIIFENKATIFCYGADQKDLISRLRGPKYGMAVVDECQSFRPTLLNELVFSVLDAGLQDLNGPLWLLGTPGPVSAGDWYEWSTNRKRNFSSHHWTILDNDHLNGPEILSRVMEQNAWGRDNATLQREWLGVWIEDSENRLVHFTDKNIVDTVPEMENPMHIIGVDYGSNDQTAFVVLQYSIEHPNVYAIEAHGASHMLITEISRTIRGLKEKYPDSFVIADTGGLGKSITEEIIYRERIHIKPAEKKNKLTAIQVLNDSLNQERLFVHESLKDLIHQLRVLQKAPDGLENRSQPADLFDAALYAFREAKHYVYEPKQERASYDDERFMIDQENLEAERHSKNSERTWWEDGH